MACMPSRVAVTDRVLIVLALVAFPGLLPLHRAHAAAPRGSGWRTCDVTEAPFTAPGDGVSDATEGIRAALAACDEVTLPAGSTFLTGPLNLTSNQILRVDGTLLASTDRSLYPLVAPLIG